MDSNDSGEQAQQKWEGKAYAKLIGPTAEQIWSFLENFQDINKWLPGVNTCELIEGLPGQPGCIRYCSGTAVPSESGDDSPVSWVKEKLLRMDPVERSVTYEVVESNLGFKSYVSTMRAYSDDQSGSTIEWSFVVDPIEGWRLEDLVSYIDSSVNIMGKRMEEALSIESSKQPSMN